MNCPQQVTIIQQHGTCYTSPQWVVWTKSYVTTKSQCRPTNVILSVETDWRMIPAKYTYTFINLFPNFNSNVDVFISEFTQFFS